MRDKDKLFETVERLESLLREVSNAVRRYHECVMGEREEIDEVSRGCEKFANGLIFTVR